MVGYQRLVSWASFKKMIFRNRNKAMELFEHPTVNEFEKDVARSLGLTIYSDDKDIIGNIVKKEIQLSKIASVVLLNYFTVNYEELLKFSILLYSRESKIDDGEEYPEGEEIPDIEKPKTLKTYGPCIGFGITYSIYFHYLFNNLTEELFEYLKARRIPHPRKLHKRLINYFNEGNE